MARLLEGRPLTLVGSGLIVCILAIWYLVAGHSISRIRGGAGMGSYPRPTFEFEAVSGFFMQDEAATDPSSFDYRKTNFGLISRQYATDDPQDAGLPQWHRFMRYLNHLIQTSSDDVSYKLIYLGRHGEGYHNVAEAYYGTAAWDDHWSKLEGNGSIFWSDAHLTETGEEQAREARTFFGQQFAWAKMPEPARYYVSPLWRCLHTAELTFAGLKLPADKPFLPVVKEMLREVMGVHTCDRRGSRTAIRERWRTWEIEDGFSEEDELWVPDRRETSGEHDARERKLLDDVFANDRSRVISMTAHSGTIASLLRVMGHRQFKLETGGLIPVLIKAVRNR